MIKELEILSKKYKQAEVNIVQKSVSLYQNDIKKEAQSFLAEIEKVAKKEKKNGVELLAVIHD